MFILENEEEDLQDFFKSIGFIPPEGLTVDYFVSPTENTTSYVQNNFDVEEQPLVCPDCNKSVTYIKKPVKVISNEVPFEGYDVPPLDGDVPEAIKHHTQPVDMTNTLKCPFVQTLEESTIFGNSYKLLKETDLFQKNTILHFAPKEDR